MSATGGEWLATAYGPPWEGIQGDGITATGIDLRPAKPAYIIAVDPTVIALGSYVHVSPNPFGDDAIAFEAADTGGAIIGKHIDIYDWQGRAAQDAWGARHVTVTPAVEDRRRRRCLKRHRARAWKQPANRAKSLSVKPAKRKAPCR